jgi:hypothetical protein
MLLWSAYAKYYGACGPSSLIDIATEFEKDFPALNCYLERTVDYKDKGRYQNLDQAKEIDDFLACFMDTHLGEHWQSVKVEDFDDICGKIEDSLL